MPVHLSISSLAPWLPSPNEDIHEGPPYVAGVLRFHITNVFLRLWVQILKWHLDEIQRLSY